MRVPQTLPVTEDAGMERTLQASTPAVPEHSTAWTSPSHGEKPSERFQALSRLEGSGHFPNPSVVPPPPTARMLGPLGP